MKKELIMMAIILIIVVCGDFVTQRKTENVLFKCMNELQELKSELLEDDSRMENSKTKIKEINNKWKCEYNKMAYFTEHDELEKIGVQFAVITACMEVGSVEHAIIEIDRCVFLCEHLNNKGNFKLVNIF